MKIKLMIQQLMELALRKIENNPTIVGCGKI